MDPGIPLRSGRSPLLGPSSGRAAAAVSTTLRRRHRQITQLPRPYHTPDPAPVSFDDDGTLALSKVPSLNLLGSPTQELHLQQRSSKSMLSRNASADLAPLGENGIFPRLSPQTEEYQEQGKTPVICAF